MVPPVSASYHWVFLHRGERLIPQWTWRSSPGRTSMWWSPRGRLVQPIWTPFWCCLVYSQLAPHGSNVESPGSKPVALPLGQGPDIEAGFEPAVSSLRTRRLTNLATRQSSTEESNLTSGAYQTPASTDMLLLGGPLRESNPDLRIAKAACYH